MSLFVHIYIQVFLLIGTDLAFKNNDKFLFNNFTFLGGRGFSRDLLNMEVP